MSTRVLFFFLCSLLTTLGSASDVLSVRDFGAKGDGEVRRVHWKQSQSAVAAALCRRTPKGFARSDA